MINIIDKIHLLSKKLMLSVSLSSFMEDMASVIKETLGVERVSIWRYNQEGEFIICEYLSDSNRMQDKDVMVLNSLDYPIYFRELKLEQIIAASDARIDYRTQEFREGYLDVLGVKSLLDVPVFKNGTLSGIICIESKTLKDWAQEDKLFVRSVADLYSVALVQEELKLALKTIESQKQELDKYNEGVN